MNESKLESRENNNTAFFVVSLIFLYTVRTTCVRGADGYRLLSLFFQDISREIRTSIIV